MTLIDDYGVEFAIVSEKDFTCRVVGGPNKPHVSIYGPLNYNGKHYKVIEISDRAFMYHDSIESIDLPSTIMRVGRSAFNGCTKLENISLPNTVYLLARLVFLIVLA